MTPREHTALSICLSLAETGCGPLHLEHELRRELQALDVTAGVCVAWDHKGQRMGVRLSISPDVCPLSLRRIVQNFDLRLLSQERGVYTATTPRWVRDHAASIFRLVQRRRHTDRLRNARRWARSA